MMESEDDLDSLLRTIVDLNHACAILEWDQETYIPDGAHESRASQLASLRAVAHAYATSERFANALNRAEESTDPSDDRRTRLLRVARRDYTKATALSTDLVSRLALAEARSKDAWRRARENDDFDSFAPHLNLLIELNREKADALGHDGERYDALLDQFEEGLVTSTVDGVFGPLRDELVPMIQAIDDASQLDDSVIRGDFDEAKQWALSKEIAAAVGYDFQRGRLDKSAHPFSTAFSIFDVRITTRVDRHFFSPAFYGTLHEVGHALYEQGIDPSLDGTPLADGTSLGMHESQSRLWENLVGRSLPFVTWLMPTLQRHFAGTFDGVDPERFYRAANRVEPSLIRVEADEVTYNLHIMIRFELEKALIAGDLSIEDLPEAWNEMYERYLGIRPESNADGVLQDIHWAMGAFGYFPTYTLGNIMSAQIFDAAKADLPELETNIRSGNFEPLLTWLRSTIHRYGRSRTATEILEEVTGVGIRSSNWLDYIRRKYGELYSTSL
ncbi:MAG: carboxypeptidase M32 [Bacteroidetes bacterium]|nr:carboxypeptidase M32 [Bacteroidota bacterium]